MEVDGDQKGTVKTFEKVPVGETEKKFVENFIENKKKFKPHKSPIYNDWVHIFHIEWARYDLLSSHKKKKLAKKCLAENCSHSLSHRLVARALQESVELLHYEVAMFINAITLNKGEAIFWCSGCHEVFLGNITQSTKKVKAEESKDKESNDEEAKDEESKDEEAKDEESKDDESRDLGQNWPKCNDDAWAFKVLQILGRRFSENSS